MVRPAVAARGEKTGEETPAGKDRQGARIPTNLRTLMILETLGAAQEAMTPTEIARAIGLPKQTVHRLCTTLLNERFLIRQPDGKRLRPARRMRQLAADTLYSSHIHIARHQILMGVADAVKETVNFVVPEAKGMTYVDRVETRWPFQVQLPIGTHVPFHCTASGKAYLASLPPAVRRATVHGLHLRRHTPNTHCDAESLLADLKMVARQGYALDKEEFVEGMVAISVPIRDATGRYLASIAFHGPIQRISLESAIAQKDVLLAAARSLSEVLVS